MNKILAFLILPSFFLTPNLVIANEIIVIDSYGQARYEGMNENEYVNGQYSNTPIYTYQQPVVNNTIFNNVNNVPTQQNYFVPASKNQLTGSVTYVGKGTKLPIFIQDEISTKDALAGHKVVAVLAKDWVVNNRTIADAVSVLYGSLTESVSASGWSRDGRMQIDFNQIETPDGNIYEIKTEKIDVQMDKAAIAGKIAAGAGVLLAGAVIGALFGMGSSGFSSGSSIGRSSAIGAGAGAAFAGGLGLIKAAHTKGDDITIPANTNFEIILLDNVPINMNSL